MVWCWLDVFVVYVLCWLSSVMMFCVVFVLLRCGNSCLMLLMCVFVLRLVIVLMVSVML